jgi:hypothetical protein
VTSSASTPPAADAPWAAPLTRRAALQRAAALLGVVVCPSAFTHALRAQSDADAPSSLTAAQLALVAALADRLLPRTDTPGALDVGVPAFVDRLHGAFLSTEERAALDAALVYFEVTAQARHGHAFAGLDAAQQDAVLTSTAAATGAEREHFLRIRELTIVGYFTSEIVGKEVLHFEPVPGRYQPCIPIADVGGAAWVHSR